VGRERAADAADRLIARQREQPALAIARIPQLRRRELEQRQRPGAFALLLDDDDDDDECATFFGLRRPRTCAGTKLVAGPPPTLI
jgi:hypothetical protein